MKIVSLFSGIGGFELGIKNSKLKEKVVFSSEIDMNAKKSYLSNFNDNNLKGDITKISEKDIPNHDLLVAGFPCQSFSIAGLQKGFNDTRGTLFFDIVRILKEKQPKYILLENVKNLVSHDEGRTFKVIIKTLNEIGYTIDFSVINSAEAGLAQNRERTYIVGILNKKAEVYTKDVRNKKIDFLKSTFEYKGFNFFNSLRFNNEQQYIRDIISEEVDNRFLISNDRVINFLESNNFLEENTERKIVKLFDLPKEVWNDLERQRRVYSINGISPTILARSDTAKIFIENGRNSYIRKFTPREAFKLQGFDDDFISNIERTVSITQQYKQAGNAVSPPVITGIINHLLEYMEIKDETKNFKFIDLFCGLGGFRIAFEKAGGECVFSSDIDKYVKEVYSENFGEIPYGDITQIATEDIPEHDILCAGFPCQPFSTAGRRLGFEDTRGTLFFEVARILKEKQPKGFILENVKGLTNHDKGKTLQVILKAIEEIGYDYKYKILNAKDYNVPQNRERWYCIGIRKGSGINIEDFSFPDKEELEIKLEDIIEVINDESEYTISETCERNIRIHVEKRNINITSHTLAYDIRPSRCHFVLGDISNCLTAKMGTGGSNVPVVINQNRKLTERECLRLMGFPDSYKIGKGYQSYKQIGNSVVVPVINKLAKELIRVINL
ncbi:DNA (cytosine-5-)-methyltransferase [Fusobacterium varium]|uniref:DNA (cytosine-5-)-methyltransferase n=1 Tax=Fusobacterium varium TaxID=856 RepID=UPI002FF2F873